MDKHTSQLRALHPNLARPFQGHGREDHSPHTSPSSFSLGIRTPPEGRAGLPSFLLAPTVRSISEVVSIPARSPAIVQHTGNNDFRLIQSKLNSPIHAWQPLSCRQAPALCTNPRPHLPPRPQGSRRRPRSWLLEESTEESSLLHGQKHTTSPYIQTSHGFITVMAGKITHPPLRPPRSHWAQGRWSPRQRRGLGCRRLCWPR
jgi:hypothetical protein